MSKEIRVAFAGALALALATAGSALAQSQATTGVLEGRVVDEEIHALRRAGAADATPAISQWPGQLGFAATADPELVREFARIAALELRAIGIQCTLSPMADIATEPRWNRVPGTFGEDGELVTRMTRAYVEGFQGKQLGPERVDAGGRGGDGVQADWSTVVFFDDGFQHAAIHIIEPERVDL